MFPEHALRGDRNVALPKGKFVASHDRATMGP